VWLAFFIRFSVVLLKIVEARSLLVNYFLMLHFCRVLNVCTSEMNSVVIILKHWLFETLNFIDRRKCWLPNSSL
jgi:hypothetical protein